MQKKLLVALAALAASADAAALTQRQADILKKVAVVAVATGVGAAAGCGVMYYLGRNDVKLTGKDKAQAVANLADQGVETLEAALTEAKVVDQVGKLEKAITGARKDDALKDDALKVRVKGVDDKEVVITVSPRQLVEYSKDFAVGTETIDIKKLAGAVKAVAEQEVAAQKIEKKELADIRIDPKSVLAGDVTDALREAVRKAEADAARQGKTGSFKAEDVQAVKDLQAEKQKELQGRITLDGLTAVKLVDGADQQEALEQLKALVVYPPEASDIFDAEGRIKIDVTAEKLKGIIKAGKEVKGKNEKVVLAKDAPLFKSK